MKPPTPKGIQSKGLVDTARLRAALGFIRESGSEGITRERLRKDLGGVSLRSVDRIITLLEGDGARLIRHRRGWPSRVHFILEKGPTWDEHVTPESRLALRLASLVLSQSGTLMWQDKLEILERLAADRMSRRDLRMFELLHRAIRVQGGVEDPVETPDILEPILCALEGSRVIEVDYQAASANRATTFEVVPYALTHDLFSGGVFLLVWEERRKTPLHLRLNRVGAIRLTQRIQKPPEALMERAACYQIGGWTSGEAPFEVTAKIQGTHWIQAFREAPPALPDFQADAAKDGKSVLVRFKANHPYGATRWLMQFGSSAEVLEPDAIRKEIKKQFLAAAHRYESGI